MARESDHAPQNLRSGPDVFDEGTSASCLSAGIIFVGIFVLSPPEDTITGADPA